MTQLDDGALRLRDGLTVWQADSSPWNEQPQARMPRSIDSDVVIVGAGITGAFLAERLTRMGLGVVVIDRHAPATGSTAASTAMLLWELDASLLELEQQLGAEAAGVIALHCRRQVEEIGGLVEALGIDCGFAFRPSLYLAGDKLDAVDLHEEHRLRAHVGIEGAYLGSADLAARGVAGEGALLYPGSARVDPMKLARGLLAAAIARGAVVVSPATAMVYDTLSNGVVVETREGDVVRARTLVLANGYEMPEFVPAERHRIIRTWALATKPMPSPAWCDDALMWEASDPYLYMRSTVDGRVIVGGADEEDVSGAQAKAMTESKTSRLLIAAAGRCPAVGGATAEFAWSGAFGVTRDSLPFIGPTPGRPGCLAAFGYGGNGITFSALAAEMIAAGVAGRSHPMAAKCALDRA